jgi:hypothetical protein
VNALSALSRTAIRAWPKGVPHARAIRTIDILWQAIGEICDLFSPKATPKLIRRAWRWVGMKVRRSKFFRLSFVHFNALSKAVKQKWFCATSLC